MQSASSSLPISDDEFVVLRKVLIREAQARIDDEIQAYYLPVCALRGQRNALSPVSCLPDEVLASIFILCARQHYLYEWPRVARTPPWLQVSYVCSRWRAVALNCPSIWTHVFFVSRTWTTVLLQRSLMAPLRIRIDLSFASRRALPMLELLLDHVSRIQELYIRALPHDAASNIISRLATGVSAPMLQSLQITVSSLKHTLGTLDTSPPHLPVLFNGTTPKLRQVDLSKLNVAWNMLTLTSVTSLKLRSVPRTDTVKQLSSILSQLSGLDELELWDVLPWKSSHREDTNVEKIVVPRLSRLAIVATVPDVVQFLSHVHIPIHTQIRLKCIYGGQADLSKLLSYLRRRFHPTQNGMQVSPPPQPIRSLSIESARPRTFYTSWSTSGDGYIYRALSCKDKEICPSGLNYDWDCAIPLKLDIKDRFAVAMSERAMVDILDHLPFSHLQSVSFHAEMDSELSEGFWRDLFNLARRLRLIKLRDTCLRSFVAVLSPDHHGWRGQNQVITVPTLQEIVVEDVFFAPTCEARGIGDFSACIPSLQCFCDALSRRRHAGHALKKLSIFASEGVLDEEAVDPLRAVVSEVIWDGVVPECRDQDLEVDD